MGAGGRVSQRGGKERRNFKEEYRILTWADGLLCDIVNTKWIFYKLQLVAMS